MKTLFNIGDKITVGDISSYIFDTIRPVAGYSLRKLSNISGPVIRVRRSIDNKESDFYADEIEGGELQGFATNDGASDVFVTVWYDQFGNNNATQTTAAEQPKIWDASTGLVTENGKAAVSFDGVDDYLLDDFTISMSSGFTIASVVKENSTSITSNGTYNIGTDGTTGITKFFNSGSFYTPFTIIIQSSDNRFRPSGTISRNTNQNLILDIFDGVDKTNASSLSFSINGSLIASDVASSVIGLNSNEFRIGRAGATFTGDHFSGKYQEIIIYESDQSANRENIETNINQYYIIFGPLRYNQRITEDSGTFALTDRYEAVYDEVTEIATPSLLCTCDAYKESTLTTYGTLYNIIPA